jgi:hypothetical protein
VQNIRLGPCHTVENLSWHTNNVLMLCVCVCVCVAYYFTAVAVSPPPVSTHSFCNSLFQQGPLLPLYRPSCLLSAGLVYAFSCGTHSSTFLGHLDSVALHGLKIFRKCSSNFTARTYTLIVTTTIYALKQGNSREADSSLAGQEIHSFDDSSPHSQELATSPYPEPCELSPRHIFLRPILI